MSLRDRRMEHSIEVQRQDGEVHSRHIHGHLYPNDVCLWSKLLSRFDGRFRTKGRTTARTTVRKHAEQAHGGPAHSCSELKPRCSGDRLGHLDRGRRKRWPHAGIPRKRRSHIHLRALACRESRVYEYTSQRRIRVPGLLRRFAHNYLCFARRNVEETITLVTSIRKHSTISALYWRLQE